MSHLFRIKLSIVGTIAILAVLFIIEVPIVLAASTWYVDPTGADTNPCNLPSSPCATIQGAIDKAASGDTILIASGTYTSTADQVLVIGKSLTMMGGWDAGFAAQSGETITDGENARRVVSIASGVSVTIDRLLVQGGSNLYGGGIQNSGNLVLQNSIVKMNYGLYGGGINSYGELTIDRCLIIDNQAGDWGAGIYNYSTMTINDSQIVNNRGINGSGIFSDSNGLVTINRSHIMGNIAFGTGGGIFNRGVMTVNSSAVFKNSRIGVGGSGGGIRNDGTLYLNNVTLSGNSSGGTAGGLINSGSVTISSSTITENSGTSGGGIVLASGSIRLRNTILAGNVAPVGPNCQGTMTSYGYNLLGDISGCSFTPTTGDMTNTEAQIGPLIDNPEGMAYHAIRSSSPAVNTGNPSGCHGSLGELSSDTRGIPRVGRCDIGAYEYTVPASATQILPVGGTPQHTPPRSPFRESLDSVALDTIGSPVPTVNVSYIAPPAGASGTFMLTGTGTITVTTDTDGVADSGDFKANEISGEYQVQAQIAGIPNAAVFQLGNFAWYVSPTGDDQRDCLSPANACARINTVLAKPNFQPDDYILVASGVYTGTGDQVVLLDKSATITGGWNAAFTQRSGFSTLDGEAARRTLTALTGAIARVEHFKFLNGLAPETGWTIDSSGDLSISDSEIVNSTLGQNQDVASGVIRNDEGKLSLDHVVVRDVTISSRYGIVSFTYCQIRDNQNVSGAINTENALIMMSESEVIDNAGTGIYLFGSTVTIDYSHIHHNGGNGIDTTGGHLYLNASSVHDNDGSGIRSRGAVTIKNSSISGNHTTEKGGGIYLFDSYLELINSTIANNLADSQGGGIYIYSWNSIPTTAFLDNATIAKNESGHGGGVYVSGSGHQVTIQNSILANNIAASYPDYMGIFSSGGYNLIENPSGAIFSPGPGDLTLVDPRLGSPEGSTVYVPLLADSPAVNSANPAGCADHSGVVLAADQRGKNRFNRCDIGAYELQPLGYSNKTANRVKASRNEIVEYSIVLENPASSATSQVWMTDTIPTELVFIPGSLTSSQGQASYLYGKITWNGVIAPQVNVSIVYSATISNSAPINKKISNPVDIRGNDELFHRSAVVLVDYFKSYCVFVGKNCTPLYFDNFSNPGSGWPVADDGKNLVEYSNNEYRILVRPPSWGAIARPGFKAADYLVSVAARNPGNVLGSYGIAFGMSQDGSTFYSFEIFPNGWYGLYRNSGQSYVKLAEAFSSAIKQGSATNLIKVKRNGSEIVVFANNQLLTSVTDSNFAGDLYLGLITFSYDQPYVDIRFDNFTVVPLACEGMVFPDLSESILPPAFENSGSFSCPGK